MKINIVQNVLKANDLVAQANRKIFKEKGALAANFISSPGSGKTTLLEKTLAALGKEHKAAVIVGDLQTTRDAERLEPFAHQVVQINTGMSCHLYANQVAESLPDLDLEGVEYVFIENVGNMVCPGEFDLGENIKVILLSLPEGDDKVAKYPTIFRAADVVLLTKTDLEQVMSFDKKRVYEDIRCLNANIEIIEVSSKSGEGMSRWISWLKKKRTESIGAQVKFITE